MKRLIAMAVAGLAMAAFADVPYRLGIAGWSFCEEKLDKGLEICQKVQCRYLCHKDFFLPYDADAQAIAEYKAKLAKFGVETDATGPLYASDEATLRKQFEFAKRFGLKTLIGVPFEIDKDGKTRVESDKVLDIVEKLVKEYDMKYAIHNHGPDMPKLFPTAASVWKRIANRDKRIGFCLDVAHETRSGGDPVASIKAYGPRIYDVHLHNVKAGTPKFEAMRTPYGDLDNPAIMTALAAAGFDGVAHIEYSRDYSDNLIGLAESMGYYLGVMQSVRAKAAMKPVPEGANTLTDAEKAEGYKLLFDGKNLPTKDWVGTKGGCKAFPEKGWYVKDGALTMRPIHLITPEGNWGNLPPEDVKLGGGGDIVTVKKYRDFVFKFDFRMTEAANSGVKYFFDEKLDSGTCEEYQILDKGHPDYTKGRGGNRQVAALYDLYPAPLAEKAVKPLGQWNSGMIVSKGATVEHWLNGVKVLVYERGSENFRATVNASKYARWGKGPDGKQRPWGENAEGRLLLQDHTDSVVSFCNLKVKEL